MQEFTLSEIEGKGREGKGREVSLTWQASNVLLPVRLEPHNNVDTLFPVD